MRCVLKNSNMTALLDLEQENMFFASVGCWGARERERGSEKERASMAWRWTYAGDSKRGGEACMLQDISTDQQLHSRFVPHQLPPSLPGENSDGPVCTQSKSDLNTRRL